MQVPKFSLQNWIIVALVGLVIGAGIWAFGVDKPARVVFIEIGLRSTGDQQAELGVRETDHEGFVHLYEADGPDLDLSLTNRPRSIYTEPIVLSNDTDNAPSRVRITMRGLSDSEVKLGLRVVRPNRTWDSTRFPRPEPITLDELGSEDWVYLSALPVRIIYHQPLVDVARVFVYIAAAFGLFFAVCWIAWRRWLN